MGVWLSESNKPVGVLDWLEKHPNDGHPWLGLLMIHGDEQGKGLGRGLLGICPGERRPCELL